MRSLTRGGVFEILKLQNFKHKDNEEEREVEWFFLKRKGRRRGLRKSTKHSHDPPMRQRHMSKNQMKRSHHIYDDVKRISWSGEKSKFPWPFIFLRSSKLEQRRNNGGNWQVVIKWLSNFTFKENFTLSFMWAITLSFKSNVKNGYKTINWCLHEPPNHYYKELNKLRSNTFNHPAQAHKLSYNTY